MINFYTTTDEEDSAHHDACLLTVRALTGGELLDGLYEQRERAEANGWTGVLLALRRAETSHARRWHPERHPALLALAERESVAAGSDASLAMCIIRRSVDAYNAGDSSTFLADMTTAAGLLKSDSSHILDQTTGTFNLGAAFDSASLWELATDAYEQCEALSDTFVGLDDFRYYLSYNRAEVVVVRALALMEAGRTSAGVQLVADSADILAAAMDTTELSLGSDRITALLLAIDVLSGASPDADDAGGLLTRLRQQQDKPIAEIARLLTPVDGDDPPPPPTSHEDLFHSTALLLYAEQLRRSCADRELVIEAVRAHSVVVAEKAWRSRQAVVSGVTASIAALRESRTRERLAIEVVTDPLTGLGNRRALDAAMVDQKGRQMVILALDLDDFKRINDTFGHQAGDGVLVAYGEILRRVIDHRTREQEALITRLGGDEFIILFPGGGPARGKDLVEAIRAELVAHDWSQLTPGAFPGASIGMASGSAGTALLAQADRRLYEQKRVQLRMSTA